MDVPVLQIMDEVDAAVKGSGEGGGSGAEAKVAAVGCSCAPALALLGVRRSSAEDGGTLALAARRWGGGFPRWGRGSSHR